MKTAASIPDFLKIPSDVVATICKQAGPRATAILGCVNHECDRMASEPTLWRHLYSKHVGPVPTALQEGARRAFAKAITFASCNLAAEADLQDFDVAGVSLIATPETRDALSHLEHALAQRAGAVGRELRCVSAAGVHSDADLENLDPTADVCVFLDLEVATAAQALRLSRWINAAARREGCAIVMVFAGDMDDCDGALQRQAACRRTYHPQSYKKFPVDPAARIGQALIG